MFDNLARESLEELLERAQEVSAKRHQQPGALEAWRSTGSLGKTAQSPRTQEQRLPFLHERSSPPAGNLDTGACFTLSGATGESMRNELLAWQRRRNLQQQGGAKPADSSQSDSVGLAGVLWRVNQFVKAMDEEQHVLAELDMDPLQDPDAVIERIATVARTSTVFRGWTVLTNTIFGVGILALSHAASECGLVLSMVFMLAAACGAKFSLHLLSCVAMRYAFAEEDAALYGQEPFPVIATPRPVTFYAVCSQSLPWIKYFIDFAIAVKCFGVSISFLIVAGKMLPEALPEWQTCDTFALDPMRCSSLSHCVWRTANNTMDGVCSGDDNLTISGGSLRTVTILFATCVILPWICYRKRLVTAWITNSISLMFFAYICVLIVVETSLMIWSTGPPAMNPTVKTWPSSALSVCQAIPVFIFAYTCHQNLFPVANEIVEPSVKRLDKVTTSAIGTAVLAYVPIMLLGYCAYGKNVQNPILLDLPHNQPSRLARLFLFFSAVFCYPNQLHPCRRSIQVLVEASRGGRILSYDGEKLFRRVCTTLLLAGSCIVAILVDDLSVVFELVGGIASNTICYLAPTLLYLRLFADNKNWKWFAAVVQLLAGCVILPCSLAGVFLK
eukprot:TRINITY_DN113660_c0_g1_i1.p1 TRINITY_DN113660_c0_g1~~TRINITY_DN113660_c0_g1_i1.p1  ORF type:complete len:615 (+),score=87.04 TRINITY_DN113660_c0_g1_i1:115-1959(+)